MRPGISSPPLSQQGTVSDVGPAKGLRGGAGWDSAPLPGLGPPFLTLGKDRGDPSQCPSLQGTAAVVPWSLGVLLKSALNPAPWHMAMGCWQQGLGQEQHTKCSGSVFLPGSAVCFRLPITPWIVVCAMAALKRHVKAVSQANMAPPKRNTCLLCQHTNAHTETFFSYSRESCLFPDFIIRAAVNFWLFLWLLCIVPLIRWTSSVAPLESRGLLTQWWLDTNAVLLLRWTACCT